MLFTTKIVEGGETFVEETSETITLLRITHTTVEVAVVVTRSGIRVISQVTIP